MGVGRSIEIVASENACSRVSITGWNRPRCNRSMRNYGNRAVGRSGRSQIEGVDTGASGVNDYSERGRDADISRAVIVGSNSDAVAVGGTRATKRGNGPCVIKDRDIANSIVVGAHAIASRGGDTGKVVDDNAAVDGSQRKTSGICGAPKIAGRDPRGRISGACESCAGIDRPVGSYDDRAI